MSKNKLISNCVALKAAKQLDPELWAFSANLEIPFLESRKAHISELRRYINSLGKHLGLTDYDFHWIANIVDGNEWVNDEGYIVKANTQTYLLLSDPTDIDGNPNLRYRDQIYHLLQATWRYEINDLTRFSAGLGNFDAALGLNQNCETHGLDNQIEMSDSLFRAIFSKSGAQAGALS